MKFAFIIYRLLLRLYPPAFQARFSGEMEEVFAAALEEARLRGRLNPTATLLKELADLPAGLAHTYAFSMNSALQPQMTPQPAGGDSLGSPGSPTPRSSWLEAFLGGLPQFLLGLVSGLPLLLAAAGIGGENSAFGVALGILAALAVMGSIIAYFHLGRPRWAAAWYLYWFVLVMSLIIGFFNRAFPQLELDTVANGPIFLALCCLTLAFVLYHITIRDRLRGLLAAVPVVVGLWIINLEFVPDGPEGINWLVTSLLAGLICMAVLRLNRPDHGLILVACMAALVGLPYSYLGIYMGGTLHFSEPGPNLRAVLSSFAPQFGVTAALAIGPQLAVTLRETGRRSGAGGKLAYRAALLGLLLSMAVAVLVLISSTSDQGRYLDARYPFYRAAIQITFLLGLLLFALGYFLLLSAVHRSPRPLPGAWAEVLLFVSALCVPFMLSFYLYPIGLTQTLLFAWVPEVIYFPESTWDLICRYLPILWVVVSVSTANLWMKKLRST
ncbi:MAG: hypothetical protein JW987_06315 [Anaerolineaceae bacterium]|nr:hypothetical protein [Anaerolineaceae bacterium]